MERAIKLKELAKVRLPIQTYKEMLDTLEIKPRTYSDLARTLGYTPQFTSFYKVTKTALEHGFINRYGSKLYLVGSPHEPKNQKKYIEVICHAPLTPLATAFVTMGNNHFHRQHLLKHANAKANLQAYLWQALMHDPTKAEKVICALVTLALATEDEQLFNTILANSTFDDQSSFNDKLIAAYFDQEIDISPDHEE